MLLLLPSLPLPLLQFAVGLLTVFVNAFVFCSCLPARSLMSHLSIFAWIITENRTHSLPLSPLSLSHAVPRNVTKVAVSADATERVIFNEGLKFKRVLLRRKRSFSLSLILIFFLLSILLASAMKEHVQVTLGKQ